MALKGAASETEAVAFRRHMMSETARMATEDGLVMTLHHGVRRNHDPQNFADYGVDTGADIPTRHDMARRLDAGYLASLVVEHRLTEEEAVATAYDLVTTIPKKVFKL